MVAQTKYNNGENIQQVETRLLGREVKMGINVNTIAYATFFMRIVMGWILFQGGIVKVLDPEWTASGFLQFAVPEGNPFTGLWASFAGNPVIDFLVPWGLTLTGLGLILGAFVRWNAFWGAFMMIMFWMASLTGGLGQFLPLEHGWVMDDHLLYAVLLFGLGALGAGRIWGLDGILEKTEFVRNNRWLRFFLG